LWSFSSPQERTARAVSILLVAGGTTGVYLFFKDSKYPTAKAVGVLINW